MTFNFLKLLNYFFKQNYNSASFFLKNKDLNTRIWADKTQNFVNNQNLAIEKYFRKNLKNLHDHSKLFTLRLLSSIIKRNFNLRPVTKFKINSSVYILISYLNELYYLFSSIFKNILKKNSKFNITQKNLQNRNIILAYEFPDYAFSLNSNLNKSFSNSYLEFINENFKDVRIISFNSYSFKRNNSKKLNNSIIELSKKINLFTILFSFLDLLKIPYLMIFDKNLSILSRTGIPRIYSLTDYYEFLFIKKIIKYLKKKRVILNSIHTLQDKNFFIFNKINKVTFYQFIYSENICSFGSLKNINKKDFKKYIRPQIWSFGNNPINLTEEIKHINFYKKKLASLKSEIHAKKDLQSTKKAFLGFYNNAKLRLQKKFVIVFDNSPVSPLDNIKRHPFGNIMKSQNFWEKFIMDIMDTCLKNNIQIVVKKKYFTNYSSKYYNKIVQNYPSKLLKVTESHINFSNILNNQNCKLIISSPFTSTSKIVKNKKNKIYYFPNEFADLKKYNKSDKNTVYGKKKLNSILKKI